MFETVESFRRAAIEYRSGELESQDPLITELETLSPRRNESSPVRSRV
ncbi:phosphoenolpyruvate carboxylase [Natrinema versiforme JCM 10478]|uniref:Phosphoenolpyruvate carboxylase n=1 Tax=Natrinema versiforme JCM 10478 TaxID=1227496 RepID=L9XRA9_9EURY|nr:phosphoenolpyruvate carboxylase [Natrinema versiforme JCM 10478]